MLWVLIRSAAAPRRGASNEYPQHMFLLRNKKIVDTCWLKKAPYQELCSHWLELPLARINFHGLKGVRAIEVLLYSIVSNDCISGQWKPWSHCALCFRLIWGFAVRIWSKTHFRMARSMLYRGVESVCHRTLRKHVRLFKCTENFTTKKWQIFR